MTTDVETPPNDGPAVTSGLELALEKEDLVRVGRLWKSECFGSNDANAKAGTGNVTPRSKYAGGYKNEFKVTGGSGSLIGVVHLSTSNVLKEPCTVELVSPSGEILMSYDIAGLAEWWKRKTVVSLQLGGQAYASCTTSCLCEGWSTEEKKSTTRVARVDGSGGLIVLPIEQGCGTKRCNVIIIGVLTAIFIIGFVIAILGGCCVPVTGRITSLDGTAEYAPQSEAGGGIRTVNFAPDPKYDSKAKVDALIGLVMAAVNEALLGLQYPVAAYAL